ncbi:MAG: multidrug transporter, partial [Patescibacteria group bacterium]|nr:multidrug transporter [Patescibacteria group bacterium]
ALFDKAQATFSASEKEYRRLKPLHQGNNISTKVFQTAEAIWLSDKANLQAAQAAIEGQEHTLRQRWGQVIATWLFHASPEWVSLMQQQTVLIQTTLPVGTDISEFPKTAKIQVTDKLQINAQFISLAPLTDIRIQGLSLFYLAVANPLLLPGSNVLMSLPLTASKQNVIIPRNAVVWWQGRAWVYQQKTPTQFVRRAVSTQIQMPTGYLVTEGLTPDDKVVVNGAQLLLSEEMRAQMQEGEQD